MDKVNNSNIGKYLLAFLISAISISGSIMAQVPEFLWAKHFGSAAIVYSETITGDLFGNVILCGRIDGTADFDPGLETHFITADLDDGYVLKLDSSGNFQWVHAFGDNGFDGVNDAVTDSEGNIFITGSFTGYQLNQVDIDAGDGVFHLHHYSSSDIFLLKLNPNGEILWGHSLGASGSDVGYALAIDDDDDVYVAARVDGDLDTDPFPGNYLLLEPTPGDYSYYTAILKWNSEGILQWGRQFAGDEMVLPVEIAVDEMKNIYTVGNFNGTADFDPGSEVFNLEMEATDNPNMRDTYISKLDSLGNFVWVRQIISAYIIPEEVSSLSSYSMSMDENENIYLAGKFTDSVDFDPGPEEYIMDTPASSTNGFILELDRNGVFVLARQIAGTGYSFLGAIAVNSDNNVFAAGAFHGTMDFDPNDGEHLLSALDLYPNENFVCCLDSTGNLVWLETFLATDSPSGSGTSGLYCKDSTVYVAGQFQDPCDFDPSELEYILEPGIVDGYIQKLKNLAKYDPLIPRDSDENLVSYFLYPNPSRSVATIKCSKIMEDVSMKVFDISGRIILNWKNISGVSVNIDLIDFSSGMYEVEIFDRESAPYNLKMVVAK